MSPMSTTVGRSPDVLCPPVPGRFFAAAPPLTGEPRRSESLGLFQSQHLRPVIRCDLVGVLAVLESCFRN